MAFDVTEGIAAAFRELPIFQDVQRIVSSLPPAEVRKAVDYAPLVGAKAGTPVYEILAAVDRKGIAFAEVVAILQLDVKSPLGQQLLAIDALIEDIKD